MQHKLTHNIPKLYLIKFSRWFLVAMPIIVPFYESNGMDIQDVMWLQALYSITIVILEIPSGYFGDVLGRKKSLVLGTILVSLGFFTYTISYSFWQFWVAATLVAAGSSFTSGSDSALLYDSLLHLQKSKQYTKYEGRLYAVNNISEAMAGLLCGFLVIYSLRLPFVVQATASIVGIFAAISLIDPTEKQRSHIKHKTSWKDTLNILKYTIINNRVLRWLVLFSSVMAVATVLMAWFAQPYFSFAEIPLTYFGILWTALHLLVAFTSSIAHRLQERWSRNVVVIFLCSLILSGYFGISWVNNSSLPAISGVIFIFLLYTGRGLATPILKDLINEQTSSEIRATVLSIRSFMIRFVFAALAPFMGWVAQVYSLPQAFLVSGVILLVGGMICIGMLRAINYEL